MVMFSFSLLAGCDGSMSLGGNKSLSEADDQFTILLRTFSGLGHMEDAQRYKDNTERQAGWKNVYIVTKQNMSELYWGRFATLEAAKPGVLRAHAYETSVGIKPYPKAIVLKIPGKDIGPAELNLSFAKGKYTVLIATFYDVPDANYFGRKNYAVEYCKQLREEGKEAYFFHGPAQSIVTIGLFDESAIEKRKANAGTVTETYIKDQRINRIIDQHPFLAENGRKVRVQVPTIQKKVEWIEKRSYVIAVPRKNENEADSYRNPESR